jgi:hypothetical protein
MQRPLSTRSIQTKACVSRIDKLAANRHDWFNPSARVDEDRQRSGVVLSLNFGGYLKVYQVHHRLEDLIRLRTIAAIDLRGLRFRRLIISLEDQRGCFMT